MIAAIVPAAGHSQRMGRPKLILPVGDRTVIDRVVTALLQGGASPVVVVAPPAEAAGAAVLHRQAEAAGAAVLIPAKRPPDMRTSVEHALEHLERGGQVPATVLLTPADSPGLNPALVALMIGQARANPDAIVVPVSGGKRGHPIALPWAVAIGVRTLPAGVGVNALLALREMLVVAVEVSDPGAFSDMDTPADYQRWGAWSDDPTDRPES